MADRTILEFRFFIRLLFRDLVTVSFSRESGGLARGMVVSAPETTLDAASIMVKRGLEI